MRIIHAGYMVYVIGELKWLILKEYTVKFVMVRENC